MFTGIIETTGRVNEVIATGTNKTFRIESPLSYSLKIDESISHNGVCLTIEDIGTGEHKVTAVAETLVKTNLDQWKEGTVVNLERSLLPTSRMGGHFVQGHVDTIARCEKIKNREGSHEMEFSFPKKFASLVIEKGSVCIDGISLTAFDVKKSSFKVAVIPYTYEHTNLKYIKEENVVNLEFDLIGKYILRKLSLEK